MGRAGRGRTASVWPRAEPASHNFLGSNTLTFYLWLVSNMQKAEVWEK